ncbi:hypothetical protein GmHk_07G019353 [Glycine max]|nr:hypothetical protein GmHk_07G019353 [Glycine max]
MQVNLYSNDDAVMCKVFSTSLKEPTLTWYKRLPPQCFISQYPISRPHYTTSIALVNLCQANGELLDLSWRRYVVIFVKIRELNPSVILHSMITTSIGSNPRIWMSS